MKRGEGDRGTVAMFTTIFAVFVLALAGLVVDGGLTIHARQRAADIAEQAARAAADDVDVAYLRRTGKAQMVNSGEPCRRARLLASKYQEVQGPIGCDSSSLVSAVVDVKIKVKLQLLGAFGFADMTMSSTASAQPQEGI
jgi:hypothetical protein